MSSLQLQKAVTDARMLYEKQAASRRRQLLILILDHLTTNGHVNAAAALAADTGLSLDDECACDNIDLETIVVGFEEYHEQKFGRRPKLTRAGAGAGGGAGAGAGRRAQSSARRAPMQPVRRNSRPSSGITTSTDDLSVNSHRLAPTPPPAPPAPPAAAPAAALFEPLAPIPSSLISCADTDMCDMYRSIRSELLTIRPSLCWNDVVGLESAKRVLREAVVLPLRYPQLFTGVLQPWRGVLLYGPPGTGKTMLAKAAAAECGTCFFSASAATLVSKYHGNSEKMVRALFEYARAVAPSIVFIDECDALMGARGANGTEHEASRRLKTELLLQLDGLTSSKDGANVFVMCASNLPWELDSAFLRRLEKRIYAPLPDPNARAVIAMKLLGDRISPSDETALRAVQAAAEAAEGFSGSDIFSACKEVAMRPLRRLMSTLGDDLTVPTMDEVNGPLAPVPTTTKAVSGQVPACLQVTAEDVAYAFASAHGTGSVLLKRYEEFFRSHESQ